MTFKAAVVQLCTGRDMEQNAGDASVLIREAAEAGATFILTPEVTNVFEPDKERLKSIALPEAVDPSVKTFAALARELKVHLHIGSLALQSETGKLTNRGLLFGPDGRKIAHYDKVHLFDIDLPSGESHRESHTYSPGEVGTVVQLPFATFGLAICYDVRFPKLFNVLANAGATVMLVPAAFTVPTGEAHWHVLLRARAIETGSYVLAAAQGGTHSCGRATYGHSLVIDPWGTIVAEAGTEPCILVCDIDPMKSLEVRNRIPALKNAREFSLKTVSAIAT